MSLILVALGGALGAVCRYGLNLLPFSPTWPLATFLTNVLGAFVMGLIVGLSEERKLLSPNVTLFWKVGFCGGFTTFSSFSLETVRLVDQQNYGLALVYSVSSVLICLIALMFGRYLAMWLGGGR